MGSVVIKLKSGRCFTYDNEVARQIYDAMQQQVENPTWWHKFVYGDDPCGFSNYHVICLSNGKKYVYSDGDAQSVYETLSRIYNRSFYERARDYIKNIFDISKKRD